VVVEGLACGWVNGRQKVGCSNRFQQGQD
jgi:hypothetical protein